MLRIRCYDCGKSYHWADDPFCPHCGAFNRPKAADYAMRVDGLNESGHARSFLHNEFHREERQRRQSGLDQFVKQKSTSPKTSAPRSPQTTYMHREEKPRTAPTFAQILRWIVIGIVAIHFLQAFLFNIFVL